MNELEPLIDKLWERRAELSPESGGDSRLTVERAIAMLDAGVGAIGAAGIGRAPPSPPHALVPKAMTSRHALVPNSRCFIV